jgi:hypothetical protein
LRIGTDAWFPRDNFGESFAGDSACVVFGRSSPETNADFPRVDRVNAHIEGIMRELRQPSDLELSTDGFSADCRRGA